MAVLSHEMHELNTLRRLFVERGGSMLGRDLDRLINGRYGTLHLEAWRVAEDLVKRMRAAAPTP